MSFSARISRYRWTGVFRGYDDDGDVEVGFAEEIGGKGVGEAPRGVG